MYTQVCTSPTFCSPREVAPTLIGKAPLGGAALTFTPSSGPLNHRVCHEEERRKQLPVVRVNVSAKKYQTKLAVKKLRDTGVAKVSTLIRPDGGKRNDCWLQMLILWMLPTKLGSS